MPPHGLQKCMIRWLNKRSVLVEKYIWRYKSSRVRLKPIRVQKPIRKSDNHFLVFFGDSKTFVAPPPPQNPGHALGFIHIY